MPTYGAGGPRFHRRRTARLSSQGRPGDHKRNCRVSCWRSRVDNALSYDTPAWFDGLLIFYALAVLAKREVGIAAGPITLLLCPLPLVVIASLSSEGDTWFSNVLTFSAAALTGFVLYVIRVIENHAIQTRRDARAQALNNLLQARPQNASTGLQPYSVYLRPFDMGDHLPTQLLGGGEWDAKEHVDLETLLAEAMNPLAPMVALGPVNVATGAGRIPSRDDDWRNRVATLVAHAYCVLVIPSSSHGTFDELSLLRAKGHLSKCVWIMPETAMSGGWRFNVGLPFQTFYWYEQKNYNLADSWAEVRHAAINLGIFLPAYDPAGMAFIVNDEGHVAVSVPLSLSRTPFRARRVRHACTRLLAMVADSADSSRERDVTTEHWRIGRRAALIVGVSVTVVGVYGFFRYGTLLGADICIAVGVAVLYWNRRWIDAQEVIRRRPSRRDLTARQTVSIKRIGDKVRVSCDNSSLAIVVSPYRNLGDLIFYLVWLSFWLLGEFVVATAAWGFSTRPATGSAWAVVFWALWLIGWTLAGPLVFFQFLDVLRTARLKERIEFDGRVLKVYNDWENLEHVYDFRLIKNLRIVEKQVVRGEHQGAIAFEVPGSTKQFRHEPRTPRG